MDSIMEFCFEYVLLPIIALCILCLPVVIVAGVVSCYQESKSPNFSLKKKDWTCTEQVKHTTTTYIQTGSVLMPYESTTYECVNWKKK